jgi:hypothetical protein
MASGMYRKDTSRLDIFTHLKREERVIAQYKPQATSCGGWWILVMIPNPVWTCIDYRRRDVEAEEA